MKKRNNKRKEEMKKKEKEKKEKEKKKEKKKLRTTSNIGERERGKERGEKRIVSWRLGGPSHPPLSFAVPLCPSSRRRFIFTKVRSRFA